MLKLQQDWFVKFSGGGGYSFTRVPSIICRWSSYTFVWKDNEAFQEAAMVTLSLRGKFKRETWLTWVSQGTNTLKVTALNTRINKHIHIFCCAIWKMKRPPLNPEMKWCILKVWSMTFLTRNIVQSDWLNSLLRPLWRKITSVQKFY